MHVKFTEIYVVIVRGPSNLGRRRISTKIPIYLVYDTCEIKFACKFTEIYVVTLKIHSNLGRGEYLLRFPSI